MLSFTIRFPLGVYHALSLTSKEDAEWPLNPLRLVGALLAAAHARRGVDTAADRTLIQRLCEAAPPLILAPESVAVGEPRAGEEVVRLRGVTRWAPRNYVTGGALSPRNLGRERAAVNKAGVAIGDRTISVVWPDLELDDSELERLARLAGDIAFLGTTRSPAIVEVNSRTADGVEERAWVPVRADQQALDTVSVRVADRSSLSDFDRRHAARRSTTARVGPGGMVPAIAIGRMVRYAYAPRLRAEAQALDPRWWGEMIVLAVDRAASDVIPKAPAAYLLGRAVRVALLGAYGDVGTEDEAPPILRGRGGEPHCAVIALSNVWGEHPDRRVLGVALVLPHERRVADLAAQRGRVEWGLRRLVSSEDGRERRFVSIPGAGRIWLKLPDSKQARLTTLRQHQYRRSSHTWISVTPVVHSHWRKARDGALLRQIATDCAHVGLPEPVEVQTLRGAVGMVAPRNVPQEWRSLLGGPTERVRITFAQPVCGPVLLGRARHFGLGLCVPERLPRGSAMAAVA